MESDPGLQVGGRLFHELAGRIKDHPDLALIAGFRVVDPPGKLDLVPREFGQPDKSPDNLEPGLVAVLLLKTLASIPAPCSVKTLGEVATTSPT